MEGQSPVMVRPHVRKSGIQVESRHLTGRRRRPLHVARVHNIHSDRLGWL